MSAKTVWSLGLLGLAMLSGVGLYKLLPPLEADLRAKTDTALSAAEIDDVQAEVAGLSVYLKMKAGADHTDSDARLSEAADAVLGIRSDWPQRVSAKLPERFRFDVPHSGGYVYGPVLEAVTNPAQEPLTLKALTVERITDALSDL